MPNPGALFYSGINFPYNIYQKFTNDFLNEVVNGYVLEFWFMIDNVIYTNFLNDKEYHYFFSKPHEIFIKNKIYYYRFKYNNIYEKIEELTPLIHQYEWNKILIFVD